MNSSFKPSFPCSGHRLPQLFVLVAGGSRRLLEISHFNNVFNRQNHSFISSFSPKQQLAATSRMLEVASVLDCEGIFFPPQLQHKHYKLKSPQATTQSDSLDVFFFFFGFTFDRSQTSLKIYCKNEQEDWDL